MGYGPVISHPRGMLQSHVRGQPNTFKFGHIVARYRYNQAKLKEYMEKNCKSSDHHPPAVALHHCLLLVLPPRSPPSHIKRGKEGIPLMDGYVSNTLIP